jgi:hypothetical protein
MKPDRNPLAAKSKGIFLIAAPAHAWPTIRPSLRPRQVRRDPEIAAARIPNHRKHPVPDFGLIAIIPIKPAMWKSHLPISNWWMPIAECQLAMLHCDLPQRHWQLAISNWWIAI